MKLYQITRIGHVSYDEYVSFIVRSDNEERALELCRKEEGSYRQYFFKENVNVKELSVKGEEGVLLGSFNAG